MIPSDLLGVINRLTQVEDSLGECAVRVSQENGGGSSIVLNNLTWARSAVTEAQRLVMKEHLAQQARSSVVVQEAPRLRAHEHATKPANKPVADAPKE